MSRAKLTVSIAVVIALAIVLWQRSSSEVSVPAVMSAPGLETPQAPAIAERAADPASDALTPTLAAAETREPAASEPPVATAAPEMLTLYGRTVDERDQPLVGVKVRIQGYKVWTAGIDVPRFPGKYDMRGFELATDSDGRFRFDVPKPTVDPVDFTIVPDPFHDSLRLTFGGTRDDAKPPLALVAADLGDFRLATTGAIRGRITDADGKALENAELHVGKEAVYTISRNGTSDATGAYVIEHVPPGTHGVAVKCEGYLAQFKKPVEVQGGQYVDGLDFALLPAPTLRGVVLDEAGAPVEGAKLWGWPKGSGSGAGSKSLADGSFTLFLPQNDPYTLEVTKEGFQPYHVNDRSVYFDPGTENLCVQLVRAKGWELFVIDAATAKPIDRFGSQVLIGNSMHAFDLLKGSMSGRSPPKLELHPEGIARVELRPGVDVLAVSAYGYRDQDVDLEPDFPPGSPIVVKMVASAGVIGRLVRGSEPVPALRIALDGGDFLPGMVPRELRGRPLGSKEQPARTERPTFAYRRTSRLYAVSDAEGQFHFDGVPRGSYLLVALENESLAIDHAPLSVGNEAVDLGDVAVGTGAVLGGRVIVPEGRSASGLRIHLDDARSGAQRTMGPEGQFRFAGLPAGIHRLSIDEVPGSIVDPRPMEVELAAGEQREVVYDLTRAGSCEVTLTVLVDSLPAANVDVELSTVSPDDASGTTWRLNAAGRRSDFYRLGKTDSNGRVTGSAPVRGAARVHARLSAQQPIEHPSVELALVLDARIQATVAYEFGRLVLVLPEALELPQQAMLQVVLRQGSDRRSMQTFYGNADQRSPSKTITFERVLTGEFEVESVWTEIASAGGLRTELYRGSETAVIQPGVATELRLK